MSDHTPDSPTVQIKISKGYAVIVDTVDADLGDLKWTALVGKCTTYARRSQMIDCKTINTYLHRTILERILGRPLVKGEQCDHVNQNGLDNRRVNLRVATAAQNCRNRKTTIQNKSGFKGVTWNAKLKKWCCAITVSGEVKHIGHFKNIREAAIRYNEAAALYHGEFASFNIIPDESDGAK